MTVLETGLGEQRSFSGEAFSFQLSLVGPSQEKSADFSPHWHEQTELQYVLSGRVDMELDGEKVYALPGDLLVVNPKTVHRSFSDGTPTEKLVISMDMTPLARDFSEKTACIRPKISNDVSVGRLMEELYWEIQHRQPGYRILCESSVMQLAVRLLRNHIRTDQKEKIYAAGKPDRIKAVSGYIDKHYMEPISNRLLAQLIHVSESRFIHLFKQEMGMSPLKYINTIRLHKARELLEGGECSVMEVAALVGFSDYNHFGRMFREKFGYTPVQARRNSRNSKNI